MVCKRQVNLFVLFFVWLFALCSISVTAAAQPLPEKDGLIHLGVSSCASSLCHGKTAAAKVSNVLQNEYTTWTLHDRHARAYKTLLSADSKAIAKALKISPAHKSKVCLDCHTDNVRDGLRGRRFQRSDGVGCEGCHGGAQKWIKSHTEPGVSHRKNLKMGMYDTAQVDSRAELCLSCHVGTQQKFASHELMAAGHPRLSFELDTFGILQPQHYRIDKDYRARKTDASGLRIWLSGQLLSAQHWLKLIDSPLFKSSGLFPEISFYDCQACHHAMADSRGQSGLMAGSGAMRLNDSYLQLIEAIIKVLRPGDLKAWKKYSQEFVQAGQSDVNKLKQASKKLIEIIEKLRPLTQKGLNKKQQRLLLRTLSSLGSEPRFNDYSTIEQLVMALSVVVDSLALNKSLGRKLDDLYDKLADQDQFNAKKFNQSLRSFSKALK